MKIINKSEKNSKSILLLGATNSNVYVNNKIGIPSPEVTSLFNIFVQEECAPQKNPQLEFFNEMLRTDKHPTTGAYIMERTIKCPGDALYFSFTTIFSLWNTLVSSVFQMENEIFITDIYKYR